MFTYADIIQCGWQDAQKLLDRWKEHGISSAISVAHNVPDIKYNDPWLPVLRHPVLDEVVPEPTWIKPILAFYDWARVKGKVLIHCQAGANRSVGTTAILLVLRHGMTPDQALALTGPPGYGAWSEAVRQCKSWI